MRYASEIKFDTRYPTVADLRKRAQKRIPEFAFNYLDGGCNEEVGLKKNTTAIREIELRPNYLDPFDSASLATELFGQQYAAPFGISPIGLQGLIWPNASEILARTAVAANIPFVLSTVATSSIERIAEITEGRFWFQLYHPANNEIRDDLVRRAAEANCPVLVLLCDTPVYGYRPREIKNGLSMPPRMTAGNITEMMLHPRWTANTIRYGAPRFANIVPYMPGRLSLKGLGEFMNSFFQKRMDLDKIAAIRDMWPGKLVLKGVASELEAEKAVALGLDGIIISNHGGRQLDAAEPTIHSLQKLAANYRDKTTVMIDSGLRSGPDIARCLASGADFCFLGRAFMYAVAALGRHGGDHCYGMLSTQLQQLMDQLGCPRVQDLPKFLVDRAGHKP